MSAVLGMFSVIAIVPLFLSAEQANSFAKSAKTHLGVAIDHITIERRLEVELKLLLAVLGGLLLGTGAFHY